ncbi:MAG TPA: ROK family protein [Candidatus Saccharibacteria bacterium]|nr:ROK family protein [Candidatus Saccharibacteria bacterium]
MYLGIDIGGTKTLVAQFNSAGDIKRQIKFPTPSKYSDFLIQLQKTLSTFDLNKTHLTVTAVPGRLDRKKGKALAYGKLTWGEESIADDIKNATGTKVLIENDANLAGLFEASKLKHKFNRVLYITISTGIGSGFITNGIIDPSFADAEVGQILLEHDGKLQRWEDFASGKAISQMFNKQASEITDNSAWYLISRNIALGLVDLIATLTPEIIVIGGGVGANLRKFEAKLLEELNIFANDMITIPPIKIASEPEEAVIFGCFEFAKKYSK